jgi:hypothetical protein
MPIDQKIDYLEFPARDLEKTKAFYAKTFDWVFQDYGEDYCAFNDGKIDGGFYRSTSVCSTSNGSVLVVLYAQDLQKTLERIVSSGGTIVRPIYAFPGGHRFHFADPNGNELAVWSER